MREGSREGILFSYRFFQKIRNRNKKLSSIETVEAMSFGTGSGMPCGPNIRKGRANIVRCADIGSILGQG